MSDLAHQLPGPDAPPGKRGRGIARPQFGGQFRSGVFEKIWRIVIRSQQRAHLVENLRLLLLRREKRLSLGLGQSQSC